MDRLRALGKPLELICYFTCLAWLGMMTDACSGWGDVMTVAPETPHATQGGEAEDFPDSRFGFGPIRSDASAGRESGRQMVNRSPAGLEFTSETGRLTSRMVISEMETPSSAANINPKPSSNSRMGIQEVAVIAGDLGFFPKTLFVTRDIPVRLFVTGASKKPLCMIMDFFQIRRQVTSQKIVEISFTPSEAGQFRFYCPINGMEGTLLVKEVNSLGKAASANMGTALSSEMGMLGSKQGDQ